MLMRVKIPVFEKLEKVNRHTKSSFKLSLGRSACSPARSLAAALFPPLGPSELTQCADVGRVQSARFLHHLRVRCECLDLK